MPEAAKANTPAGAEAFVRYLFDTVNVAWTKPDTALIPSLCPSSVAFCKTMQDGASLLEAKKQRFSSAPLRIESVKESGSSDQTTLRIEVTGQQTATSVLAQDGSVATTNPSGPFNPVVYVAWKGSAWQVQDIKASS